VSGDRKAFDSWYQPLVERSRQATGCIVYDYLLDPDQAERGRLVEACDTREDRERFLLEPLHIEMVARGSRDWGMDDLRTHAWSRAEGHAYTTRDRTETPVSGRDVMNRLVAEYLQADRT
jgi:hypothetical protein